MADRNALGAIGAMLGAATFLVMIIGSVVVAEHLNGHLTLEENVQMVTLHTVTQ